MYTPPHEYRHPGKDTNSPLKDAWSRKLHPDEEIDYYAMDNESPLHHFLRGGKDKKPGGQPQ